MTQFEVPEVADWTPEELAELGKRQRMPTTDPIRFVILDESAQVSKEKGHLMLVWDCAPLMDPDDVSSANDRYSTKNFLLLPKKNPKVAAHKPLDTTWRCVGAMRAIYGTDTIPYPPRFNKSSKEWEQNGEILDGGSDEAAVKNEEAKAAGLSKVMEHYRSPGLGKGRTFVANVEYNEEGFARIKGIRPDLGDDEQFADLSEL